MGEEDREVESKVIAYIFIVQLSKIRVNDYDYPSLSLSLQKRSNQENWKHRYAKTAFVLGERPRLTDGVKLTGTMPSNSTVVKCTFKPCKFLSLLKTVSSFISKILEDHVEDNSRIWQCYIIVLDVGKLYFENYKTAKPSYPFDICEDTIHLLSGEPCNSWAETNTGMAASDTNTGETNGGWCQPL